MTAMTLRERLLNPAWTANPNGGDAILDTERTIADMREAATEIKYMRNALVTARPHVAAAEAHTDLFVIDKALE